MKSGVEVAHKSSKGILEPWERGYQYKEVWSLGIYWFSACKRKNMFNSESNRYDICKLNTQKRIEMNNQNINQRLGRWPSGQRACTKCEDLNSGPRDLCDTGHDIMHHQYQCVCDGMEGRDRRISLKLGPPSLASTVAKVDSVSNCVGGRADT